MGTFLADLSLRAAAKLMIFSDILAPQILAATYGGSGLEGGLNQAGGITGISSGTDLKQLIIHIIEFALNFVTLLAVGVVIYAGIRLIISLGEDESKEKAKKSLIHVAIGLVIVILSRAIVLLITNLIPAY